MYYIYIIYNIYIILYHISYIQPGLVYKFPSHFKPISWKIFISCSEKQYREDFRVEKDLVNLLRRKNFAYGLGKIFGKNSREKASVENIYEENVRKILRFFVRFYPLLKVGRLTFKIIVLFASIKAL